MTAQSGRDAEAETATDTDADTAAGTDADAMADAVITARPERVRRWCLLGAGAVFVLFTVAAVVLRVGSGRHTFGVADQIAVFVLGAAIAAGIMVPARSRLRADSEKLWIRNAFGTHEVPWNLVTAVRFDDRSPWATLEFPDGDLLAVMAVRATDGERAVQNVRALRALCERRGAAR